MQLIFATNNPNKVKEVAAALENDSLEIISLAAAGIDIDIPEPHDTLEENAFEKSSTIFSLTQKSCFSEDTGLLIDTLDGEPGVKSARYADDEPQYADNIDKVLQKMQNETQRSARFKTIVSLIINGTTTSFEGLCEGTIINERRGSNGFGYDPIFIPDGSNKTFAEMTLAEKKEFSHRSKAIGKLVLYLKNLSK